MQIQLISQFGKPVRGVSPYSDGLLAGLRRLGNVNIEVVDYKSAYPGVLHPAQYERVDGRGELSWYSPGSWKAVAGRSSGIMHIQHWAPPLAVYLWPLVRLAKKNGRRVVVTVHNPIAHEKAGVFRFFERRLLCAADMLLVHGAVGCRILQERMGSTGSLVRRIEHGMAVAEQPVSPTPDDYASLGLDPAYRYVLLFGNLRGYKGVDVLLDAWKRAQPHLDNVRLVIAGRLWDGGGRWIGWASASLLGVAGDARRIQRMLTFEGSMRGIVLREGFQSDAEIDALIRICEFAVFPYVRFSGQSGAACRAAALGRPVLVSRVGGLPDLAIDESWVVGPGDSLALADRLLEKLAKSSRDGEINFVQLNKVRGYDWGAVARDHVAAYRELA